MIRNHSRHGSRFPVTSTSAPGAPTIGTATATGSTTATVSFTQPANNGGSTITSYTATSSPGGITGVLNQAGSGTITITGLTGSTSYTFTVTATNAIGTSAPSAASNSITTYAAITKSLRFRSSASAYLSRTPAVAGNQSTWTWSGWIKRGLIGSSYQFFGAGAGTGGSPECYVQFDGDQLLFQVYNGSTALANVKSTALYRDPAAWYHIVIAVDVTQATASDRVLFYVNGQKVTAFAAASYPGSGALQVNATTAHQISGSTRIVGYFFDGDIAEVNFVDGYPTGVTSGTWAATNVATIFGASSVYNQWLPIAYAGTYGTNGFYLPFTNTTSTSTLVADSSGNANNWTPNNISLTAGSTYDSLTDVPTLTSATVANYAVWNAVAAGIDSTITDGNLKIAYGTVLTRTGTAATIGMTTGKFYWEVTVISLTSSPGSATIGISNTTENSSVSSGIGYYPGYTANGWCYDSSGDKGTGAVFTAYGATYTVGDVIGVAFDATAGSLTFYKNNVSQGVAFSSLPATTYFPAVGDGSTAGTVTYAGNFGQQPFVYTAPSGFLPLNTFNI